MSMTIYSFYDNQYDHDHHYIIFITIAIVIITITTFIIVVSVSQEAIQGIKLCAQKTLDKEVRLSIRLHA
jgi:hypothetical protein